MRNRLPFFLTLVLAAAAVLAFNIEANAQWVREARKNDRNPPRKQVTRDGRPERFVMVNPGKIYRDDAYYRNDRRYEGIDNANIAQLARLNGYQDGLHEGTKDARDGDRFDPFAESDYQDGDGGYKSRYGNKAAYKQIYRQSFLRGYREAYSRYLGYTERNW